MSAILILSSVVLWAGDKQVVPVKVVEGMVFVPVKVNGVDTILMLDTGATNTVVSPEVVHVPVNAAIQTATVTEGHQQVSVGVARLDIQIGKAHFNAAVVLTDLNAAQKARYGKFDGLLGQSILGQFKSVRLDYQNRVIELER